MIKIVVETVNDGVKTNVEFQDTNIMESAIVVNEIYKKLKNEDISKDEWKEVLTYVKSLEVEEL